MDPQVARNLTASFVLLTTAALVARSFGTGTPSPNKKTRAKKHNNNNGNKDSPQYVTGLVNIGNTCFMNSVLQALASLPSLRAYLEARKEIGLDADSITLALYETVEMLNTIHRRPTSKRLVRMVNTVKAKAAHVLTSQQQDAQELFQILSSQLSEEREKIDHPTTSSLLDGLTVSEILTRPARRQSVSSVMSYSLSSLCSSTNLSASTSRLDGRRASEQTSKLVRNGSFSPTSSSTGANGSKDGDPMTASLMLDRSEQEKYNRAKSPFMGLLASRVSCVDCGYTAAIRHSTFDNLSLTVPMQYSCNLEDCLESFVHLDTIRDFNCRKCTLVAASKDLGRKIELAKKQQQDQEKEKEGYIDLGDQTVPEMDTKSEGVSNEKPRRRSSTATANHRGRKQSRINLAEVVKIKERIDHCLATNIEMDLAPLELPPVKSNRTTKHSMIAKPPQALCLHLNRSMFTASGQMTKNPCKVQIKPFLDFTQFTTSGHLTITPTKSMSRRGSCAGNLSLSASASSLSPSGFGSASSLANVGRSRSWSNASLGINTSAYATSVSLPPPPVPAVPAAYLQGEKPPLPGVQASQGANGRSKKVYSANGSSKGSSAFGAVEVNVTGEDGEDKVIYKLWAVVVHLGSHNSGHFVTYRRIPPTSPSSSPSPSSRSPPLPSLSSLIHDTGSQDSVEDVDDARSVSSSASSPAFASLSLPREKGRAADPDKWWRVSDEDVQIVEWELVRNVEAYMLFYEKQAL